MALESGEVTGEVEVLPADDAVITIDPIELAPIAIAEVLPADGASDVPPDAQTFGGPVDGGSEDGTVPVDGSDLLFTTFIVEDAPAEDAPLDGSAEDGTVPVDDSTLYTTFVVDDAVTDGTPVDGSSEDGSLPIDDSGIYYTMGPVDLAPVEDTPADGSSDTPVEATGDVEVIGRPVDPEPNWRTLDGPAESSDGSSDDSGVIAGEDYPDAISDGTDVIILDKDVSSEDSGSTDTDTGTDTDTDGQPDVIYTLDPSDPLIYASSAGELPGRPSDPLPYERTDTTPVVVPVPEVDPTPVHYAQADTFHTGLDLL